MTLKELGIINDMPRGWVRGETHPLWHISIYKRWVHMWNRCKNPHNKDYKTYKDCEIDERYRYLSNYIHDIMMLENFDKLYANPSKWYIDNLKRKSQNNLYRGYKWYYINIVKD